MTVVFFKSSALFVFAWRLCALFFRLRLLFDATTLNSIFQFDSCFLINYYMKEKLWFFYAWFFFHLDSLFKEKKLGVVFFGSPQEKWQLVKNPCGGPLEMTICSLQIICKHSIIKLKYHHKGVWLIFVTLMFCNYSLCHFTSLRWLLTSTEVP